MVAFIPTIPNPNDFLDSTSQPQLRNNNLALDARFGQDHYKFSNATGQSGKHNRVTTPIFITQPVPDGLPPVVIATEPVIAAFQQTVPFGVLQYSYGWNVAASQPQVPTPITTVQSPQTPITIAGNTTINIMDFTGITRAIAVVYVFDVDPTRSLLDGYHTTTTIYWNGTSLFIPSQAGNILKLQNTLNVLQILNSVASAANSVIWTMQMLRMQ